MVTVPCKPNGQARWIQRSSLSGKDYVLQFDWSQREGAWTMSLADGSGAPISSHAMVVSLRLLERVTDDRKPPGELVLLDSLGAGEEATFTSLGSRHQLVYLDAGEIA
jgi:hypothetical protein